MDCLSPKDLLAASDGLLSEAEQREQAAHLAQCPRCGKLERTVRELVRLAAAVAPTAPLAAPGSCPAEMDLLDFVGQRMTVAERVQMEAHLSGCRQCLWQVAAMARAKLEALPPVSPEYRDAVRQAEALVDARPDTPSLGWRLIPAWRYALASAAAVLLIAVGLYWNEGKDSPPPVPSRAQSPTADPSPAPAPSEEPRLLAQQTPPHPPRAAPQPETHVRSAPAATQPPLHVLWPQEGQQVTREELEIRWQPLPGVSLYRVTILDRSGNVLWEAQAQGDRVRVPDDVILQTGERYFAWVEARVENDGVARSHSVAFEIRALATR